MLDSKVELAAVAQGLGDAQRDADQVAEQEAGEAEDQRDGKALADELPGGLVRELVRFHAHAEAVRDQPLQVALVEGLIETEMLFELLAVFVGDRRRPSAARVQLSPAPSPRMRMMICSTGPPGTNWVMPKQISVMPRKVGNDQQQAPHEVVEAFHGRR